LLVTCYLIVIPQPATCSPRLATWIILQNPKIKSKKIIMPAFSGEMDIITKLERDKYGGAQG